MRLHRNRELLPGLNIAQNEVLRNRLKELVFHCNYRIDTGRTTRSPCCRADGGRVFLCSRYGHEPARMYDCLRCQKAEALEHKEPWIISLAQRSSGWGLSSYSRDQVLRSLSAI